MRGKPDHLFEFSIDDLLFIIFKWLDVDKYELQRRTKAFAHRCVKLSMALPSGPLSKHLENQLIRCSTSVAANYRASCLAQSKKDFEAKLSRVVEEIDESCFWLEFVMDELLLKEKQVLPLLQEAKELTAIFVAARKTSKSRPEIVNNK